MKLLPYPKYKQSGVEWLGEVPAHWEVRTLTSIANEITTGPFGSQLHASEYVEDGIPVVNPAHIVAGSIRPDILSSVDDATALRLERHRLKQHDVIVGRRGEIGRCAVVGRQEDGWLCGTGALVVRLHNSDPRYILAVFSGAGFREMLSLNAVGTTMLNLNPMIVGRMLSPVPPLPEQRAIADFLHRETSRLDTLVAKKRTLIERLREKRTALISRTVTRGLPPDAARDAGLDPHPTLKPSGIDWPGEVPVHWDVAQLRRRCTILDCMHRTVPFVEDGIPLASIREVHGFEIDLSDAKQTTEEEYLGLIEGGRRPQIGDILFSRNATVGDAAIAATSEPFAMGQDVCLIRCDTQHPRYVLYLLRSEPIAQQVDSFIVGATFRRINVGQIRTFWGCWPPVDEQLVITNYLDRETAILNAMVDKIETVIERLQEYRAALITAAVTGKVDVRKAGVEIVGRKC